MYRSTHVLPHRHVLATADAPHDRLRCTRNASNENGTRSHDLRNCSPCQRQVGFLPWSISAPLMMGRGVASAAIRSLAVAAECLTDPNEQTEIISILEKIKKETGWRIDFLKPELKKKWGWTDDYLRQQQQQQQMPMMMHTPPMDFQYQQTTSLPPAPPVPAPQMPRGGIPNPMMQSADFNAPHHPYEKFYVAPIRAQPVHHSFYNLFE